MSQFPSVPPPGAYVPPIQNPQNPQSAQGFSQQQPNYGYQQPQAPLGAGTQSYGTPTPSHKPANAFGQAFNQAVTQGRPMLDKLGKTISSKLGNKSSKQSTPQHLENYPNYQQHHQQGQPQAQQYQQQGQPQAQQYQQQGQPQVQQYEQPQPQNYQAQGQQSTIGPQSVYQTPQQSPLTQSAYGTPGSGNLGQNNYFPQQTPPTPSQQAPPQQFANPSFAPNTVAQNQNVGGQLQGQSTQGQSNAGQNQGYLQQTAAGHASGQQTGVIGGSQTQSHSVPHPTYTPSSEKQQQQQQQQHHWAAPAPVPPQHPSPVSQSPPPFNPTPPPQQYNAAPPVPVHPNQQQSHKSPQPQQPQQQQQWTATSPASPHVQHMQQPFGNPQPPTPVSSEPERQQQQHSQPEPHQEQAAQSATPVSQNVPSKDAPTDFIAELPADLGQMNIKESSKPTQTPSTSSQVAQYQAYRPTSGQSSSSGPGYTIPRRAVSASSLPVADPWRFADPSTELPTREFFIIADLVFDGIDRRFEPQNTGLLEASKVLESWRLQQLPEEAAQLFAHDSYMAFAKIWSLEGVPHVMVPCQPSLMPTWNFQRQMHSHELKIAEASLSTAAYPTYMPALNRAGWYKYFFLGMLHQPEDVEKLLSAFCADSYKPGILHHPDVQKRDRNESSALVSRATAISTAAVRRVCEEVVAQMQSNRRRDAL